jgi:hypothetical protein
MLGGSNGQDYTITNEGSGYTSRPSIVIEGTVNITPSVYQATPHNAATPWNMPGVDYYVGIPSGTALKDPTDTANLPSGATYNGSDRVTITGCGVTLDGFDFTLHNTALVVDVSAANCTTTIQDSKFSANATSLQPIALLSNLGSDGTFLFQRNEYDGLAPTGGGGSGFHVNDPIQLNSTSAAANVILKYNYFHNFEAKVIQASGSSSGNTLTEQYNLFADFGSCSGSCAHGEAEYTYCCGGDSIALTLQFNTYIIHFHDSPRDLTSLQAVQADDVNITGTTDDHNVIFGPGPQLTCNQNNQIGYLASADVFDGQQEGGTLSNTAFTYNYLDNSGLYFPWYHNGGTGVTYTNNVDAGTGTACN